MEYWITHIKKDNERLQQVKAFINTVEGLKNPVLYNRNEIITTINENQDTWYTCKLLGKNNDKRVWKKTNRIHLNNHNAKPYIRIDTSKEKADYLGALPKINETTQS